MLIRKLSHTLYRINQLLPKELRTCVPVEKNETDTRLLKAQCQSLLNVFQDDSIETFKLDVTDQQKQQILKDLKQCQAQLTQQLTAVE